MLKNFEDLQVYQKSFDVSLVIHKKSFDFPKYELFSLTSQIRRASKSICANIAEGFVKQQASKPEFKRYLLIAMGSATEMIVWIKYAEKLDYISGEVAKDWLSKYNEILKMLQGLYSKVDY